MKARPVVEALRRGALAFAANPLLVGAQVSLWLAVLVLGGLSAAALVAGFLPYLFQVGLLPALDRFPWGASLSAFADVSPGAAAAALAAGFLASLVGMTLLLLLASWVQAGTYSVLLAADRQAPERGRRAAFRAPRGVFRNGARRHVAAFFWLLNIYALVATFLLTLAAVGVLALVAGIVRSHALLGALALVVTLPVVVVAGVAAQVGLYAASREIVAGGGSVLEALSSGIARVRATAGPSALLFLLLVACGLAAGGVVSGPRVLVQVGMMGREDFPSPSLLVLFALLSVVEWGVICSFEVVKTGAFVALWTVPEGDAAPRAAAPGGAAAAAPPVAFVNSWSTPFEGCWSADAVAFLPSPIRALAHIVNDPSIISFAAGVPNPETFPAASLAEAASRVLASAPTRVLQYDVTRGYLPLRERVCERSRGRGLEAHPDRTILTTGSQQGLDLCARALLDPGDVVLVEVPTYVGALVTLAARRARPVGVPRGPEGIDLSRMEETVVRLRRGGAKVKVLYTIPNFQNPSGLAMTAAAKDALAAACSRLGLVVLEDDPYGELAFGAGDFDPTPLAARIPERTVWFGSFSKTLAAGLRTGWMHAPAPLVLKAELAKQAADLCSSTFDAAVLDAWLSANDYEAHLSRLRGFYRGRKEVLLAAMRESFPASCSFTDPAGGLFTWVSLPEGLDAKALLPKAVEETRAAYVPGEAFVVGEDGRRFLRMTFAKEPEENLRLGAARLGAFFAREAGTRTA